MAAAPTFPGYYRERGGGFLVAAAITKYVFIAVNRNFDGDLLLKYSQIERVADPSDAQHRLLREILLVTEVEAGVEISSMADIPAGTGLGSSGAFTVGALQALHAHRARAPVRTWSSPKLACHVELDRLGEPIGKQDQYIAAVGGVTAFSFDGQRRASVSSHSISRRRRAHAARGQPRCSSTPASAARRPKSWRSRRDGVGRHRTDSDDEPRRGQGTRSRDTPTPSKRGDLEHVRCAAHRAVGSGSSSARPTAVHQQVDRWIRAGLDAGATGGKLVGAGDGGFLLFYAEAKPDLRKVMAARTVSTRSASASTTSGATVIVAE